MLLGVATSAASVLKIAPGARDRLMCKHRKPAPLHSTVFILDIFA